MTRLTYEECMELKDAGFPQVGDGYIEMFECSPEEKLFVPNLSFLIKACGEDFCSLNKHGDEWWCDSWGDARPDLGGERCEPGCCGKEGRGLTPEQAVKNLWLAINNGKDEKAD